MLQLPTFIYTLTCRQQYSHCLPQLRHNFIAISHHTARMMFILKLQKIIMYIALKPGSYAVSLDPKIFPTSPFMKIAYDYTIATAVSGLCSLSRRLTSLKLNYS